MTKTPKPMCAKCGHEVDRMEIRRDEAAFRTVVTVYCHGEQDTSIITARDLMQGKILPPVAFRIDRIKNTPP